MNKDDSSFHEAIRVQKFFSRMFRRHENDEEFKGFRQNSKGTSFGNIA